MSERKRNRVSNKTNSTILSWCNCDSKAGIDSDGIRPNMRDCLVPNTVSQHGRQLKGRHHVYEWREPFLAL